MFIQCLFSVKAQWNWPICRLGLALCALVALTGCAPGHQTAIGSDHPRGWQPWQVIDAQTGRALSTPEWLTDLKSYEIIYLGEEHFNKHHIDAALKILDRLVSDGIRPTIGMEMFGWDGQSALDEYVSNHRSGRGEFLEQVRWTQNWGGAFEAYEPLVVFARDQHLSIRAMNPPKPLIRRVVKFGLEQVRQEPEWTQWGMHQEEIVDDPAYRARIVDQLQRCHGGGAVEHIQPMYEASMVRDEGMAKTLTARLEELRRDTSGARSVIVSYTGGGHIQYALPVPMRVARRLSGQVKYTTIYMTSFDESRIEEVQELVRAKIADYIWLTPMSAKGPPQRCR
ncbi:MAG: ChaN family lipoprotein [Nitrospira sp.]|nr:ChaN family lipoprotein [Nitrospira sp.]